MRSRSIPLTISLTVLIAAWIVAALLTDDATILPTPWEVARITWQEASEGNLFFHMMATMTRVAAAFSIAMVLGIALGILLGRSPRADLWLGPWVVVFLNIPALVIIVLCYLWIGLNETAAITAVAINKTAMVAVTMREGTLALAGSLRDLAQVFRLSRSTIFRHIMLPQLWPYLYASMRNGIAIIWKIVLVVEFLGRPNGVGFQIHLYFQLFETGYVLAYALSFVALMLLIEYGGFSTWQRRVNRWREKPAGAGP